MGLRDASDITHRKRAEGLVISKKVRELKLDAGRDGRLSLARLRQANLGAIGAARDRGQMINTA